MNRNARLLLQLTGAAMAALLVANFLEAKGPFLKKAQEAGFADAKDCGYCHTKPKGGKELNERGIWLMNQKAEKKADAVDMTWLKDYKAADAKK